MFSGQSLAYNLQAYGSGGCVRVSVGTATVSVAYVNHQTAFFTIDWSDFKKIHIFSKNENVVSL